VLLLHGDIVWRRACFWGPEVVFRLNAHRLILVAALKKHFFFSFNVEVEDADDEVVKIFFVKKFKNI
jgi:hypothetical protein